MAEKEYIEREAVLEKIEETFAEIEEKFGAIGPIGNELMGLLNGHRIVSIHPTADVVEVVHARWITEENTEGYRGDPHCTACKGILGDEAVYGHTPGVDSFFYCPNCGARMDGGVNHGDV